jgi:outer membrane protein assembly factor BamB
MKKYVMIVFWVLITQIIQAQGFQKVYSQQEISPLFSLVAKEEGSHYMTSDGNYLVLNNTESFRIVKSATGDLIIEGEHLKKSDEVQLVSNILGSQRPGFMADGEALKESTGFYVFAKEEVVVFLDWTLDKNLIKAYDMSTGEKLWETDKYRYTPEKNSQLASVLATMAVNKTLGQNVPTTGMTASGAYYHVDLNYGGNYGSKDAQAFITPLEGTVSFLMKVGKAHACLDIQTGEEKWIYDDYAVNIAEHFVINDGKEVVLVNFNPSYFAKSENLIFKLDAETGKEKLRIEHLTNYVKDRVYVSKNRLILDFYGVEMYDLTTDEQLLVTIEEKYIKAYNTMTSLMGNSDGEKNQQAMAHPSIIQNGILYTGTSRIGRQVHPVKPGSRNITYYAYNLETGEEIWKSSDAEHKSQLVDVTNKQLILKYQKGLNKHIFYALDKKTGRKVGESEKIKQYLLRNGAGHIVTNEAAIISGKKGIYVYDLNSWDAMGELDIKNADVGKLQAMDLTDDGLFIVGDDGIGFYNAKGEYIESIKIDDVTGSGWTSGRLIAFTEDELIAVNMNTREKVDGLERKESILFSDNLKHWLLKEDEYMEKYTLNE